MITLLLTLVFVGLYVGIGFSLGRKRLPAYLTEQRSLHPSLYDGTDNYWSRDLRNMGAFLLVRWALFWPITVAIRAAASVLGREVTKVDPMEQHRIAREQEARNRELQERIWELEHELGIDR
jgi:hypothetical protein